MIKLVDILEDIPKNKWTIVNANKYADDLITIVQTAYKSAPLGSFIKSKKDLAPSDWLAIDVDEHPDIDATIFYRRNRGGEPWAGYKIQGIGHDGSRKDIDSTLKKLKELLGKPGWWVEASDVLEAVLYKLGAGYVKDETFAQKVFPNSDLKFIGNKGEYTRKVGGTKVKETIFGNPNLK